MPVCLGKCLEVCDVLDAIYEQRRVSYSQLAKRDCIRYPKRLRIGSNTYNVTHTLKTFYLLGTTCVFCKAKGHFFRQERVNRQQRWHLVLYTVDVSGTLIRMTRDHIIPQAHGGSKNSLSNVQVLCQKCNEFKGHMYPSFEIVGRLPKETLWSGDVYGTATDSRSCELVGEEI